MMEIETITNDDEPPDWKPGIQKNWTNSAISTLKVLAWFYVLLAIGYSVYRFVKFHNGASVKGALITMLSGITVWALFYAFASALEQLISIKKLLAAKKE